MEHPLVVSLGGGINSVALLVGLSEKRIRPDLIEYSDPGHWLTDPAEKPETYRHMDEYVSPWLKSVGFPSITVVSHKSDTLRASCLRNGTLPSKGYGFPGCSVKFKHQIMERFERSYFGDGYTIIKAIGYHADESRRSDIAEKSVKWGHYIYRYFLREWGWNQADCVAAINRAGLPVPMKSACYFCPSSKKHEVLWLAANHPDLFAKAVEIEDTAEPYHASRGGIINGLGRHWSWKELVQLNPEAVAALRDPDPIPCMCYDGGDEMDDEA